MITEDEFRARVRDELRYSRQIARYLAQACAEGDVDSFNQAAEDMQLTTDGWRLAMVRIAKLTAVPPEIRNAFLDVWIQHKHLPLKVGHRPTMAAALRVLFTGLPRPPEPITLFRGASAQEPRRRLYGFSWSTDIAIARDKFAEPRRVRDGGSVLMRTVAPPEAVLLVRTLANFYDEGEVIVDPYRLGRIEVVERFAVDRPLCTGSASPDGA